MFWLVVIMVYYLVATFLPIDKIIGKLYPVFGACLIIMAVGIAGATILMHGSDMPELTLSALTAVHPNSLPKWSMMFVTVACGAISGFHATQSPMMARCITSEKQGRTVFYGDIVAEGVIALIWASAGVTFYTNHGSLLDGMQGLTDAIAAGGAGTVVYEISTSLLGPVGGVLAMIGVIACPITSGDTAYRSARLTIADWFHIDQSSTSKRAALSVPLLAVGAFIALALPWDVLWRYFSWANQTLAMIVLWTGAVFLFKYGYPPDCLHDGRSARNLHDRGLRHLFLPSSRMSGPVHLHCLSCGSGCGCRLLRAVLCPDLCPKPPYRGEPVTVHLFQF